MLKQLLPRGGELQESEEMEQAQGMTPPGPRHSSFFMAWQLGEERQQEKLINNINSRDMGFWDKRLSAIFQFYKEIHLSSVHDGAGSRNRPSCLHDDDLFCKTLLQEPGESRQIWQVTSFPEMLNPPSFCLYTRRVPSSKIPSSSLHIKILPGFQGSAPFPPLLCIAASN